MNELQPLSFKPSGFWSVLGDGLTLMTRTLSNTGVLSLLIGIPGTLLLMYGMSAYLTAFVELMGNGSPENISPEQMSRIVGPMMLFYVMIFLYVTSLLIVQTASTLFAWEAADGRRMGMLEGLGVIFRRPFWMVMAQTFMLGLIMMLAFVAFIILGAGAAVGATAGDTGGSSSTILSILVIIFFGALLYFFTATLLRVHCVVIEERGPWRGLIASMALTKGNWWRVFGMMVIAYVALALLTAPFLLLANDNMIDMLQMMRGGTSNDPEVLAERLASMSSLFSWKVMLPQIIQSIVLWPIFSNLLTAMYIDLRARRGDFEEMEDNEPDITSWGEAPQN